MTEPSLTPRQLEVAALVAKGFTNPEIASMLELRTDTVKSHIKTIASTIPNDSGLPAKYRVLLYYRSYFGIQGAA